jgi:hypothetical protein
VVPRGTSVGGYYISLIEIAGKWIEFDKLQHLAAMMNLVNQLIFFSMLNKVNLMLPLQSGIASLS